jgi:uncharacterized protein (TIGR03067 family)
MALAILLAFFAPLLAGDQPQPDVEKDFERFEGTWKFVFLEMGGMQMPESSFKGARLILKGNQFTLKEATVTYGGTFKLGLAGKVKTIDVTFTSGPETGKTTQGIYELEGDVYKVCMALVGKPRPTEFVSKPGSGHVLEILHREKAKAGTK